MIKLSKDCRTCYGDLILNGEHLNVDGQEQCIESVNVRMLEVTISVLIDGVRRFFVKKWDCLVRKIY